MDVKKFMDKDLHHVESIVKELSENVTRWDTDKVFEQACVMFDLFSRRFALEDAILTKLKPCNDLQAGIKTFLKRRLEFREILESVFELHPDEPDFRKNIGKVLDGVHKHMAYREGEFYPQVINKLAPADLESLGEALEDGLVKGIRA